MGNVQKIKYSISYFDLTIMKQGGRRIIELTPDGCLTIKDYVIGTRKVKSKKECQTSSEAFVELCAQLRKCIDEADTVIHYVDDSDAELSIFYFPDRVEKMPRGLGCGDRTVGSIFTEFVSRYTDKW